jgi:hypothetical protein
MKRVVSYASDIKPLFTEIDQKHMKFMFDLWSYDDVKENANEILDSVSKGRMPPPKPQGEGRWSDANIALFQEWIDGQCQA